MREHLETLARLRGDQARDPAFFARVRQVKRWQRERLARTYPDLAADPRHAPAVRFFLDELYGEKDGALRDADLRRMVPTMQRLLPAAAYRTVGDALALDVLAEEFDQALARILKEGEISPENYAAAFRAAGRRADRLRQVALMRTVGAGLEHMVRQPLIYPTLKMLRSPARLAGLGEMQRFLEVGFTAFRQMGNADYFLDTIGARETRLIERLFDGHASPFDGLADIA